MNPLVRTFRWPLAITIVAVIVAGVLGSPQAALILMLLAVLEISISFDNAIVNAAVLRHMTEKWQRVFLTWGILIAVFGMRLVFPIVIVAVAAGISLPDVLSQAVSNPDLYARHLEESNPIIAAFGGMFLMLVFLEYFIDSEKDIHWLGHLEKLPSKLGKLGSAPVAIALGALLVTQGFVDEAVQVSVLVAGIAGVITHQVVSKLGDLLAPDEDEEEETEQVMVNGQMITQVVAKAGLASFLYLEVLDASFSFDGVIGAFAISKNIFLIAAGLGIGAIYIRSLTVYLVHQGTLQEYRYLENGAHWAIGALSVLLLVGIQHHVPEVFTGLIGATLIALALVSSILHNKREAREEHATVTTPSTDAAEG